MPLVLLLMLGAGCAGSDAAGPNSPIDRTEAPTSVPTASAGSSTPSVEPPPLDVSDREPPPLDVSDREPPPLDVSDREPPPLDVSDRVPPIEELLDLGLDATSAACFVEAVDPDGDGRIGDPALFVEAFGSCM